MITVFYARTNSINPSYTVLYEELCSRRERDLQVVDVSSCSREDILRYAKTSDLIVCDSFIFGASELNPTGLNSVMLSNWKGVDFYRSVWQIITDVGVPVLYIASGWDLHWTGHNLMELLPKISGIAWLYERKPVTLQNVPAEYRDGWMSAQTDPLENWEMIKAYVPTRIELIHSIGSEEFNQTTLSPIWQVCVAGDTYRSRVIAAESASREGLKVAPFRTADKIILRTTGKLPIITGNSFASLARNYIRQLNQKFLLRRSAANFVCGSGYKYPVRKFFEVPAARSALLSYPCTGMQDYGFVDGEHYIQLVPEDFGREAKRLLQREADRKKLVNNACEMVSRLHSTQRRVDDLLECMRRMAAGRLRSAKFHNGEFVIE